MESQKFLGKHLKRLKNFSWSQNWQIQFKLFKILQNSGISGLSFWAIEPIWKDWNYGKFRITSFQWQTSEKGAIFMGVNWSFRWKISKKFHLDKEFFSRKHWTSLGAIVLGTSNFKRGVQIFKVTYMSYLGTVFENLTNKV